MAAEKAKMTGSNKLDPPADEWDGEAVSGSKKNGGNDSLRISSGTLYRMKYKASKANQNFRSLKANFMQVLVSPRVNEIPVRFLLTAASFISIMLFSVGGVFLYNYVFSSQVCAATPLPLTDNQISDGTTCNKLFLRKDFEFAQTVQGETGLLESKKVNLQLRITRPEKFSFDYFSFNPVDVKAFNDKVSETFQTSGPPPPPPPGTRLRELINTMPRSREDMLDRVKSIHDENVLRKLQGPCEFGVCCELCPPEGCGTNPCPCCPPGPPPPPPTCEFGECCDLCPPEGCAGPECPCCLPPPEYEYEDPYNPYDPYDPYGPTNDPYGPPKVDFIELFSDEIFSSWVDTVQVEDFNGNILDFEDIFDKDDFDEFDDYYGSTGRGGYYYQPDPPYNDYYDDSYGGTAGRRILQVNNQTNQTNASGTERLIVKYSTPGGLLCELSGFLDEDPNLRAAGIGHLMVECTLGSGSEAVFQILWTTLSPGNILQDFVHVVANLHDATNQEILLGSLATSFALCCTDDNLAFFEAFGLMTAKANIRLGFGFALEGVITFLIAITCFRYKLGLNRKMLPVAEQVESNAESAFTVEASELEMKESRTSTASAGENGEIDYVEAKLGFPDRLFKMEQKTISRRDLKRCVFNPRCHTVPYASTVSVLTLIVLVSCSAILAQIVKEAQTREICESRDIERATDSQCEPMRLDTFSFFDTGDESVGSLGINTVLDIRSYDGFNVEQLHFTDEEFVSLTSACKNEDKTYGNGTMCLTDTDIFDSDFSFNETYPDGNSLVHVFIFHKPGDPSTGVPFMDMFYEERIIGNETIIFSTFTKMLPKDEFGTDIVYAFSATMRITSTGLFNSQLKFEDSSAVVLGFLNSFASEEGSDQMIEAPLLNTFARCCFDSSLNYFEYFGLMIGYMTLAEGLFTFLVALLVYYTTACFA